MTDSILLFDRSAILGTDSHFWRLVSGLGICVVPQVVVDEINSLVSGFGTDQTQEAIASEFQRFLDSSNWQVTDVSGTHPMLNQKLGNSSSRNSRLDLAISECAYGLALTSTSKVILVTNTNSLLEAVNTLNQENLSAVNIATVRSWAHSRQIPTQKIIKPPTTRAKTVRNANFARGNKLFVTLVGWTVIAIIGLLAWRSLQPKEFKQFWQKTGLPNLLK